MDNVDELSPGISRRDLLGGGSAIGVLAALLGTSLPVHAAASGSADAAMLKAFDAFLARLGRSAEIAFARSTARRPIDHAAGLLHILNNISLGLAFHLHNADPMHPELFHYFDPARKQGGDNSDALYLGVPVDGSQTYRLYGNRGTARHLSITTVERGSSPFGGGMGAALFGRDLNVQPNGDFEVVFSATPHPGNWLKLSPKDFRVTIRQFFADWENERPMRAMVERLGPPAPPPLMSAERVMAGLEATAQWVESTVTFWQDTMDLFRRTPNRFVSWRATTGDKVNATPGGDPAGAHWNVPEGMALILRVKPPACEFWNVEFNNPWWETQDYRYRLTGVNIHNAVLEDDGELIAVIAHQDPGLPNWLDTAGYTEGQVGRRWMFAESAPDVACTLVEHASLHEHLPKAVKRITPEGRREQLAARRRGIYNRFNWM